MTDVVVWLLPLLALPASAGLMWLSVLGFRFARAERRALAAQASEVDWRTERRRRRRAALQEWQADFDALLPPPPPCTSTEHNHIDDYRFNGVVRRVCATRPQQADGVYRTTSAEAVEALRRAFANRI